VDRRRWIALLAGVLVALLAGVLLGLLGGSSWGAAPTTGATGRPDGSPRATGAS